MGTIVYKIWDKLFFGLAGGLLLFAFACTYGDTFRYTEQAGKVRVELEWGQLPRPDATSFYFYPDGQNMPLLRTGTASGFVGTLPAGTYRMVVVNADYRNLTINTSKGYEGAFAHALTETKTLTKAMQLTSNPENLYGTGLTRLVVDGKKEAAYVASPQNLVQTLKLDVIIKGGEQLASIQGTLSGVAVSVHVANGQTVRTETASMPVPLSKQADGRYHSSVTTFGVNPTRPADPVPVVPNRLTLDATLTDGTSFTSELDLTAVIDESIDQGGDSNQGSVETTIDVEIKVDPTSASGFRLLLMGWHTGTGSAGNETNK